MIFVICLLQIAHTMFWLFEVGIIHKGCQASRGRGYSIVFEPKYKVVSKTVILMWKRGGGSNLGQICVMSFMNAPLRIMTLWQYWKECDYNQWTMLQHYCRESITNSNWKTDLIKLQLCYSYFEAGLKFCLYECCVHVLFKLKWDWKSSNNNVAFYSVWEGLGEVSPILNVATLNWTAVKFEPAKDLL